MSMLKHGTTTGYSYYGCKCDACRAANAKAKRESEARRRRGEPPRVQEKAPREHRRASYNKGCRCASCKKASRDYHRSYRARKKAEVAA